MAHKTPRLLSDIEHPVLTDSLTFYNSSLLKLYSFRTREKCSPVRCQDAIRADWAGLLGWLLFQKVLTVVTNHSFPRTSRFSLVHRSGGGLGLPACLLFIATIFWEPEGKFQIAQIALHLWDWVGSAGTPASYYDVTNSPRQAFRLHKNFPCSSHLWSKGFLLTFHQSHWRMCFKYHLLLPASHLFLTIKAVSYALFKTFPWRPGTDCTDYRLGEL